MPSPNNRQLDIDSHALRSPLTGMQMAVHLLLEEKLGDLNETQRELLESAKTDCDRLLKAINDLLEDR